MTKLIPILSGRCLVVELPEGAGHCQIDNRRNRYCYYMLGQWDWKWLPEGNWRIIWMLSEVTEEQIIPLVERESKPEYSHGQEYPEYIGDEWWYRDYCAQDEDYKYSHYTALESFHSAIEVAGYYLDENPMGGKPSVMDYAPYCLIEGGNTTSAMTDEDWESYHKALAEYKDSQSRVLDRSRCLLLGRGDD